MSINFKSSLFVTTLTRFIGLPFAWFSVDVFLAGWLKPTWERLPYILLLTAIGLPIVIAAAMLALNASDIEITDDQLRLRRFFTWKSVPLESITSVKRLWPLPVYLRVDYAGKRIRVFFNPDGFKTTSFRSPVVEFLREQCKRNADTRAAPRG